MKINIAELNKHLLTQAQSLLLRLFPLGRVQDNTFLMGATDGRSGSSLVVRLDTGAFRDYASAEKGNGIVELWAAARKIKKADAARELAGMVGAK